MKTFLKIFQAISRGSYIHLVVVILLYLLVSPAVESFPHLKIIYYLFLIAILLAGLLALHQSNAHTLLAAILALPMTGLVLLSYFYQTPPAILAANIANALFILYIIITILKFVFSRRSITSQVIFAALAVYLLIGVFWSLCYSIMAIFVPNAFRFPNTNHLPMISDFIYLSFVTITTLGYGDITPVSNTARSMAFVEALIGQIYMTVLIAWLVGIFVSERIQKNNTK